MTKAFLLRGTPSVFMKKNYQSKWPVDTIKRMRGEGSGGFCHHFGPSAIAMVYNSHH